MILFTNLDVTQRYLIRYNIYLRKDITLLFQSSTHLPTLSFNSSPLFKVNMLNLPKVKSLNFNFDVVDLKTKTKSIFKYV